MKAHDDERSRLKRHLEEINSQIANLKLNPRLPLEDRVRMRCKLTRDWLSTYEQLRGREM